MRAYILIFTRKPALALMRALEFAQEFAQGLAPILALVFALFGFATEAQASQVSAAQVTGAQETREWTMLIFLNANNNLVPYDTQNLKEMESVGSDSNRNIVVQWANNSASVTRRMLIEKSTDSQTVTSKVVEELPVVDMGSKDELVKFLKWGMQNYPAKHYFVEIWNHGSGWHGVTGHRFDISIDEKTGHAITTLQLGDALREVTQWLGRKIDIYGSDACLMGSVEVAQEVADSVQVFVGSEELEPLAGWPYDKFLSDWAPDQDLTPGQIAKILVNDFVKSYKGGSHGTEKVTLSALELSQLPQMIEAVAAFRSSLLTKSSGALEKINSAITKSIAFDQGDYVDLGDFLQKLSAVVPEESLQAITGLQNSFKSLVIENQYTDEYKGAGGFTMWLPLTNENYTKYRQDYKALKFDKLTSWHEVLEIKK